MAVALDEVNDVCTHMLRPNTGRMFALLVSERPATGGTSSHVRCYFAALSSDVFKMRIAIALSLIVGLGACSSTPGDAWQRADGTGPNVGDTSRCHSEARWQAHNRYPPQVLRNR